MPVDTCRRCTIKGQMCTPGGQLYSPHEIKLPPKIKKKTLPKMSLETDSTDGCSSNAGPSLRILLTVVAPVISGESGWPTGQQPPLQEWKRTTKTLIYFNALQSQMCSDRRFFVTATTQDGCENVWNHPLHKSVPASARVRIQVCERRQEGFTTQILYCAVMFYFVIRKQSAGLCPGGKASKRIWMAAATRSPRNQTIVLP